MQAASGQMLREAPPARLIDRVPRRGKVRAAVRAGRPQQEAPCADSLLNAGGHGIPIFLAGVKVDYELPEAGRKTEGGSLPVDPLGDRQGLVCVGAFGRQGPEPELLGALEVLVEEIGLAPGVEGMEGVQALRVVKQRDAEVLDAAERTGAEHRGQGRVEVEEARRYNAVPLVRGKAVGEVRRRRSAVVGLDALLQARNM